MPTLHGHTSVTGGRVQRTPTYISWQNMLARCRYPSVPSYPHYGGRGIAVCQRWHSFVNFLADMGERPEGTEISRKDNDGDYGPGNCEWKPKPANLGERNQRVSTGNIANLVPGAGRGRSCPPDCTCKRHERLGR